VFLEHMFMLVHTSCVPFYDEVRRASLRRVVCHKVELICPNTGIILLCAHCHTQTHMPR